MYRPIIVHNREMRSKPMLENVWTGLFFNSQKVFLGIWRQHRCHLDFTCISILVTELPAALPVATHTFGVSLGMQPHQRDPEHTHKDGDD